MKKHAHREVGRCALFLLYGERGNPAAARQCANPLIPPQVARYVLDVPGQCTGRRQDLRPRGEEVALTITDLGPIKTGPVLPSRELGDWLVRAAQICGIISALQSNAPSRSVTSA
jgi:hypothetical protein